MEFLLGVKDEIDVMNYRTFCGTTFLGKDANETQNAYVIQKLRDAGAIIVGKVRNNQCLSNDQSPCGHTFP
eukprot:TRINITY_DN6263_c0_g1_i1.p1 TRINITY_DN6263_c0_g1~~TRINITY_DN6263_c0_g1_i1.p1  ORF type:complete len:71 (+),score=7.75 TRINITY_DN6263_c0_g1_i1:113-325(+)